jgi:DNA-binding GntR family transcriptional regulator
VRRLKGRFTPDAHAGLQAIVDQLLLAVDQHDLVRVHELDRQFHRRLWELTDNTLLVEVAAQMRSRTSHFYRAAAASLAPDELRKQAYSHQKLLDVIASGDLRAAERAMQKHVEDAARRIAAGQPTRMEEA